MKIAILGYGKMGRIIDQLAIERKHQNIMKVSSANAGYQAADLTKADVAIEFSTPQTAVRNMEKCFQAGVPVVVGTTAWYQHFDYIKAKCKEHNGTLFYATNFSIGVNLFFELNRRLAVLMKDHTSYYASIDEIHHTQKLDAPSGTSITIAEQIIQNHEKIKSWVCNEKEKRGQVKINAKREGDVPGTHVVNYESDIDKITISHEAKNRTGFAMGAILAAEWVVGRKGIYTMKDMLNY